MQKKLPAIMFFVFGWILSNSTLIGQEFSIKSINAKKGTVKLSAGKNDGLRKNKRICFYNDSKKITCGKIKKISKTASLVKVKKSKAKKITKDMTAVLSKKRKKRYRRNNMRTNFKLMYSYLFMSPITYNSPFYRHLTQTDGNGGAITNEPGGINTSPFGMIRNRPRNSFGDSFLGGGAEIEFALSKSMSLALGGR